MIHNQAMRVKLRTRRNLLLATLAAVVAHGLLLYWLTQRTRESRHVARSGPEGSVAAPKLESAAVALIHEPIALSVPDSSRPVADAPGSLPESARAAHDQYADERAPAHAPMDRDLPGRAPASAGGGAPGGADSWTGRTDHESFQTQPWNNPESNRLPRHADRLAQQPRSPESLVRRDSRAFADRTDTRPRARAGSDTPMPGGGSNEQPGGAGVPIQERDWRASDPMFDGPTGTSAPAEVRGRMGPTGQVLAEVGPEATEAETRARTARDHVDSLSRSDQLDPAPIEMTRPRAGGDLVGVPGLLVRPEGLSPRGTSAAGSAARSSRAPADGDPDAVRASRQNPYFSRMYQRMNEYVVFPEDLAASLRQGEVIVRFRLARDGSVSELTLYKSSGYRGFDRQVLAAVRHLSPFGEVPRALLGGRSSLTVLVPYYFKNPLIRH